MGTVGTTRPLRCGIAGYGYMGEIRKRVIDSWERLELVGVVEPDAAKRANLNGTRIFDSYQDLLGAGLDIMFVCTPNRFSPEICVASMQEGVHVFCEKPPGRTLQDIKNIIKGQRPDTKLMFGFNHRFHPAILKAKAIADSGRLGRILSLRGLYGKSGGQNFEVSWRNDKKISGGGILLDQGIHMLDLFRFFCGDFEYVKCFTANAFWDVEVEDNAYVILQNTRNQNAIFHSSATLWKHTFRLEITLSDGYMVIEGLLSKSGSYGRETLTLAQRVFEDEALAVGNPSEEVIRFDKDLSWDLEVREFVRCIDEDAPVTISSAQDALKVMEIIDGAYRDAEANAGFVACAPSKRGAA